MFTSDVCEDDEEKATGWAEGLLARQYKDMFGRLPNLNHQDPTKTKHYTQGYVPKSIWNKLFEFA